VVFPLAFVAVRVTVYVPGVLNSTALFLVVLVAWLTFGGTAPKFQFQEVAPVPPSLNETARGGHPESGVATIVVPTGACAYPQKTAASSKSGNKHSFLING
jgi:hypothetical protein